MKEKTTRPTTRLALKQRAFAPLWFYLSSCVGMLGVCFCAAKANTNGHPENTLSNDA